MLKVRLSPLRLHQIMYTMIYPAVLGSFIYSYGNSVANSGFSMSEPIPWLIGFLFIALLTLDYIYSIGSSVQLNYSGIEFVADLLIVILLYVTMQRMLGSPMKGLEGLSTVSIWVYLFLIKGVASLWELWDRHKRKKAGDSSNSSGLLESDVALCLAALAFLAASGVVPASVDIAFLALFLVLDGIFYINHTSDA